MIDYIHGLKKIQKSMKHKLDLGKATVLLIIYLLLCLWGKKGGRFYCLFVDFSKAFDRVNHVELINSLIRKGVDGKFVNIHVRFFMHIY